MFGRNVHIMFSWVGFIGVTGDYAEFAGCFCALSTTTPVYFYLLFIQSTKPGWSELVTQTLPTWKLQSQYIHKNPIQEMCREDTVDVLIDGLQPVL